MLTGDISVTSGEAFVDGYRWSVFSLVGYFRYTTENFGNTWFSVEINLDLRWFTLLRSLISLKNSRLSLNESDAIS